MAITNKNLNANLATLKKAPKHKVSKDDKGSKPILPKPASETDKAEANAEILTRLAKLDMLGYAQAREKAAEELGGIKLSMLDEAVKARRAELANAQRVADPNGTPTWMQEVEPWNNAINGARLLDRIREVISRYIAMDDTSLTIATLWVLRAWCYDAFRHNPFLHISSPTMGCGKSTLMELLSYLVCRPFLGVNMTPATVFRTVDTFHPTILADEIDRWLVGREELASLFNAAHAKRGAFVPRCTGEGPDYDVKVFSVWAPIVISGIGKTIGTIEDRSLPVRLTRQRPGKERRQLPTDIDTRYEEIPAKCARWRDDHIDALRKAKPQIPAALRNRVRDNWWSLLAVAEECGGDWPERARKAAIKITHKTQFEEQDLKVLLLEDIRSEFRRKRCSFLDTSGLISALKKDWAFEDRPWNELNGKPINGTKLAAMLRPFGIRSVRVGKNRMTGYQLEDFKATFASFLQAPEPDTLHDMLGRRPG